ncbi:MAG: ferredoxin--NADP reductase [Myxococcales bacterium]|nr:MAG: ferredoxin--NADP reductase [Myxococcales bacterium]
MAQVNEERVLSVHHWNDSLFTFTTTRSQSFRFQNGHFAMVGLGGEQQKPLLRAYSVVSANYEESLEFYSIKIPDGALTSRLQHIKPGDTILISTKATGTLVIGNLTPGKNLYLLATGTGLAPFMSIIRDPATYETFDKVVLAHGVRHVSDLGYRKYIEEDLRDHELVGEYVRNQLLYYPTVTREPFRNQGRVTDLLESGKLSSDVGLPPLDAATDRVMICGSPAMLRDISAMLDKRGFSEGNSGEPGAYLYERAFAEK